MTTAYAKAQKDGKWWVAFFTVDGKQYGTQGLSFSELERMVKDAADCMGYPDIDVVWQSIETPHDDLVTRMKQEGAQIETLRKQYAQTSRDLVATLRSEGFTIRDIAVVLGISSGRVQQLAKG
ncbi:MAG: hypothetical protein Q4G30_02325 [Actinomycetaceae bacterium]|nr:hypothetical protein [Actinomycetaceae bacterium]